jgi:hypothetical protein
MRRDRTGCDGSWSDGRPRGAEPLGRFGSAACLLHHRRRAGCSYSRAAVDYDASRIVSLGGALSKLADADYGRWC